MTETPVERVGNKIAIFQSLLYQKKKVKQDINKNQLKRLRDMWPDVFGEIREQAITEFKRLPIWKRIWIE